MQRNLKPENKIKLLILYGILVCFILYVVVHACVPSLERLSGKLNEWKNKKEITLVHNNFFETGVEGILEDVNAEFDLPEELYILEKFRLGFDQNGIIQSIDTELYGSAGNGEMHSYRIQYNGRESNKLTVKKHVTTTGTLENEKKLSPMLVILKNANCQNQVEKWIQNRKTGDYEILYFGSRSFDTTEGLQYLPGDVDGDGTETSDDIQRLNQGGLIFGFEVSLHIPEDETIIPVRYIMEPQYITPEALREEQERQQTDQSKNEKSWTIDNASGSMYFFLNDNIGWRLIVSDAAAGSRYYELEKTTNGGTTWTNINHNPFGSHMGAAEGLIFYDETLGIAGLSGASQTHSSLYLTRDGGITFALIELPMEQVTDLPESAQKYNHTLDDYCYLYMPKKNRDCFKILVTTENGSYEGISFESTDNGMTWNYAGIVTK